MENTPIMTIILPEEEAYEMEKESHRVFHEKIQQYLKTRREKNLYSNNVRKIIRNLEFKESQSGEIKKTKLSRFEGA